MKQNSIWLDGISFSSNDSLDKDIEVDVLIIGGGITGLSTAYHLLDHDLKVALVEANLIGHGVTSKTTGKLTYLQEDVYSKIEKNRGIEAARLYYQSQREAISLVTDIIKSENIECDLASTTSFVFTNDSKTTKKLVHEKSLLESFGADVSSSKQLPNEEKCQYNISVSDTYVFHPIKYLIGLKKLIDKSKISLYERTRIESIRYTDNTYICYTEKAFIKAKKVILALHYPYFLKPFFMPSRVTLEKSYVGAFLVPQAYPFHAISLDNPVCSFRFHQDGKQAYQIQLYGSHNICMKYNEKENFDKLRQFRDSYHYLWSNIDIITSDALPYIGSIQEGLFLGTGYNTWGMTNGSLAGKILAEQVLGNSTEYDSLFVPRRGLSLTQIFYLPITIGSSIKSYIGNIVFKNKSWYRGKIRFDKRRDKDIAIYTDDRGIEHIVYLKCPHLSCNLIFNEEEMTWDCPCHGSRFDIDGHCIEGPSNQDICYREET